jgi:hypothetical protein
MLFFCCVISNIRFCYKNDVLMSFIRAHKNFEPGTPNFLRRLKSYVSGFGCLKTRGETARILELSQMIRANEIRRIWLS